MSGNSLLCSHENAVGALLNNESADLFVPSLGALNILNRFSSFDSCYAIKPLKMNCAHCEWNFPSQSLIRVVAVCMGKSVEPAECSLA